MDSLVAEKDSRVYGGKQGNGGDIVAIVRRLTSRATTAR